MGLTSLYAALSGLNAHSFELSVIGNNLSNINTPGYKSSAAAFQDLLSQTLTGGSSTGDINFLQVGLGVQVSATSQNFGQGSLQSTGNVTDVAIQGNGFFVVKGDQGVTYTRAGNFHVDATGNLVTPDGALYRDSRSAILSRIRSSRPANSTTSISRLEVWPHRRRLLWRR